MNKAQIVRWPQLYAVGNEEECPRSPTCMCIVDKKRIKRFAAVAMIGDGMMAVVQPSYYPRAWKKGPKAWRTAMEWLAERPGVTRAIGAAEVVGGVLWILREGEE